MFECLPGFGSFPKLLMGTDANCLSMFLCVINLCHRKRNNVRYDSRAACTDELVSAAHRLRLLHALLSERGTQRSFLGTAIRRMWIFLQCWGVSSYLIWCNWQWVCFVWGLWRISLCFVVVNPLNGCSHIGLLRGKLSIKLSAGWRSWKSNSGPSMKHKLETRQLIKHRSLSADSQQKYLIGRQRSPIIYGKSSGFWGSRKHDTVLNCCWILLL